MLLLGTQENRSVEENRLRELATVGAEAQGAEKGPPVAAEPTFDLIAHESMPESSLSELQERFVLEETAAFLRKVLAAAEGSLESQRILMF